MHRYTYIHANMHTHTQRELKKKKERRRKAINKTTMIERAKQKWDLQLSTSFFGKVSSNKVDLVRGVEECLVFHREPPLTSRRAVTETAALKQM